MAVRLRFAIAVVALAATAACTPGPLGGPVNTGANKGPARARADAEPGALEATRQKFFGVWQLVALESVPPNGGARAPIAATGTLTYDEFGNLTIDARTTDRNAPVAAREVSRLSFKGRAVIDVPNSELKLMALTGNVDPNEVLSPERRRKFEFTEDTLKLSSFDEKGVVTAISTWKRQ